MLPNQLTLGPLALRAHNVERMYAYYTQVHGFRLHDQREDGTVVLGSDEHELVHLIPDPQARPVQRTAGLYHVAYLYPNRPALAAALVHLRNVGWRIDGASDHGVSEALYLSDIEGNGIELYVDRPREQWPTDGNGLAMVTEPLDVQALLKSAGDPTLPILGHMHLHVGDLAHARRFYVDALGFDLMQTYGLAAEFVSTAGYHHHLGYNIWRGKNVPPAPPTATGLVWWTMQLPSVADIDAVAQRLAAAQYAYEQVDGVLLARDPSGNQVRIVAP